MKTLTMILLFLIGISAIGFSQKASKNRSEKRLSSFQKKRTSGPQSSHFAKRKTDKMMAHNGTTAYAKMHETKYVVDGDGFKVISQNQESKKRLFKKKEPRKPLFRKRTKKPSMIKWWT